MPTDPLPAPVETLAESLSEEHASWRAPHRDRGGRFYSPWASIKTKSWRDMLAWKLNENPHRALKREAFSPRVEARPLDAWRAHSNAPMQVMWLGHASVYLRLGELHALIDPVFGDLNRFVRRQAPAPLSPDKFEHLDVVLLTHGHYDHLDVRSLDRLAQSWPQAVFLAPLGQGRYLPASAKARLVELDWWQQIELRGATLTLLPAQHWHQRGPLDHARALWGGWWIDSAGQRFYHMGDSGYFQGFEAFAEIFGSPDVMMLPLGAYEPRWFMRDQHMDPQDALKAWRALGAPHAIGMHHSTFDLSDEPLGFGVEEFRRAAEEQPDGSRFLSALLDLEQGGSAAFESHQRVG